MQNTSCTVKFVTSLLPFLFTLNFTKRPMKQLNYRSIFSAVAAGASKTLRHQATAARHQPPLAHCHYPSAGHLSVLQLSHQSPFCHTRFIDSVSILGLFFKRTCCEILYWVESKTGFTQWLINLGLLPMGCRVNHSLSQ